MQTFLRQATASQARALGPFIDDTDFKTPKTALTIANTDIKIVVNGGASADKNSGGGTHRVNGVYGVTFDATDTATVGEFFVSVVVSGALPVFAAFEVLEEAVYDALFAASAPGYVVDQPVNVTKFGGTTVTARDIGASVLLSSGTGTGQIKIASGYVAPDWGDVGNKTTTNALTGTTISTAQVVASVTAGVTLAASAVQAIWDALTSALTTVGSIGKLLVDNINATISSRLASASYTAPPSVADIADGVWDELIAGHLGAGSTGAALNAAGSAGDPWSTALPGAYGAGTAGHIIGTALPDIAPGSANGLFRAGSNAATSVTTAFTAAITGNITGNLSGSVGSVTADVGITQAGADKVWLSAARTLTSFGTLVADVATAVWAAGTRTLTSFGTLAADTATAVWAAVTRTITGGTVTTVSDKTGYRLSATGVDDIWDEAVDGAVTARQSQRLANSANGGIVAGAATATVTVRDLADTKDRITASVDADGNRTAVTRDLT